MKHLLTRITLTAFLCGALAQVGCVEEDGPGYEIDEEDEDQWPGEDIDDPQDETDTDASDEDIAAAAIKSCSQSFDTARGSGWYVSGAATLSFGRRNGVTGIYSATHDMQNAHPSRGGNNKIGVKFQVYSGGSWKNATDWIYWRNNLGTGSRSGTINKGVRTTLPVRARVRFSWDVRFARDPARSCYIRLS